jgi:hypothetical protein
MSDEELRELVGQLTLSQAETGRQMRETERRLRESKEETDRQLRELGKQIGGLGEKFGSYTEGMALPSMKKLLAQRFNAPNLSVRNIRQLNGRSIEIDVLATANSHHQAAYLVEVKSRLRLEGIEQMLRILKDFPEFFPEHRDKKVYGILATIDAPEDLRAQVLENGIYLAQISDDTFTLQVPDDFVPRVFHQPAA